MCDHRYRIVGNFAVPDTDEGCNQCGGHSSDKVYYNGVVLPCIGIDVCDTLTTVLQKIEEKLCILLSTTTTTTTLIL